MRRKATPSTTLLAALLLAGTALTAGAVTFTLNDGTASISCPATGSATIAANGDISATVQSGCIPAGGGDPPPAGSFTLTVTKNGAGSGTVSSSPAGITNCAATCNASFPENTAVTLTAAVGNNSTFGSWSGCASTNGLTCSLTMNAAKSVTATFNASGGGGGGDPGAGLWINGSNYVHDRGSLTELYVPRCVPNQYNNCRAGGQQSQYDTLVAGQTWSMRIPTQTTGFGAQPYSFSVERAETGETLNAYDFAISATAGDFNVPNNCKRSGSGAINVHGQGFYTPPFGVSSCALTPGTRYYLNVRPQTGTGGATQCGQPGAGNACRYRIVMPGSANFPYGQ